MMSRVLRCELACLALLLVCWPAAGSCSSSGWPPSPLAAPALAPAPAPAPDRPSEHRIALDDLKSVAIKALERALSGRAERFEFDVSQKLPDVFVDGRSIELRARSTPPALALARRMAVWVDICEGQIIRRSVMVPIDVRAYQTGWVAVRDLQAGSRLLVELLREAEVEVSQAGRAAWHGDPAGHMTLSPVLAGGFLAQGLVEKLPAVQRGDRVQMVLRQAGVQVLAQASALQDGQPGQSLQVRVDGARGPVLARVIEPGKVEFVR